MFDIRIGSYKSLHVHLAKYKSRQLWQTARLLAVLLLSIGLANSMVAPVAAECGGGGGFLSGLKTFVGTLVNPIVGGVVGAGEISDCNGEEIQESIETVGRETRAVVFAADDETRRVIRVAGEEAERVAEGLGKEAEEVLIVGGNQAQADIRTGGVQARRTIQTAGLEGSFLINVRSYGANGVDKRHTNNPLSQVMCGRTPPVEAALPTPSLLPTKFLSADGDSRFSGY